MQCRRFLRKMLRRLDRCFVVLEQLDETGGAGAAGGGGCSREVTVVLDEEQFVRLASADQRGSINNSSGTGAATAPTVTYLRAEEDFLRQLLRAQCFSEYLLSLATATSSSILVES